MNRSLTKFSHIRSAIAWSLLTIGALGILAVGHGDRLQRRQPLKPTGEPRLVSSAPLAEQDGMMCEFVPASAGNEVLASMQAASAAKSASSETVDRAPLRTIRDTYPTYSAIALDLTSNEVYMQDENLFGYRVFGRLDNTPPTAAFTEPRRIVQGLETGMEFNCGLYVDPASGDVYSVNNDTQDSMVIFPRDAEGNVKPKRKLHTPHGTWGIAVNEKDQELYLTVEHQNSVVVYRKFAEGEEKPLRSLRGDKTLLADPHGIALDTARGLLYVSNHGNAVTEGENASGHFYPPSITVYPLKAEGEVAPLRVIQGSKTELNWPAAMALDPSRNELYVANDAGDSLLVFRATDSGNVAPIRAVKGPKTGIKNPTGVALDLDNGEVWVANMGNHRATVFSLTANGNTAPLRSVRSAPEEKLAMAIGNPGAVGFDTKREEILVPN